MAQIQDWKSKLYSQKQSIRDELSAPQYLESAGDELIKYLAKKQANTTTSLEEQLDVVQNFEKGFELNPDSRKGISSLKDFKKHVPIEQETFTCVTKGKEIQDLDELMRITGLSRHELELGLCEKPSSKVSQLYMFAIGNKIQQGKRGDTLENKLLDHPINHLREIEEEYFGHVKKSKLEIDSVTENANHEEGNQKASKKKKPRKRKRKIRGITTDDSSMLRLMAEPQESSIPEKSEESPKASTSRPSLWDVKDMKKWSESKKIGCKPRAFYTIKSGKIIKLEKESGREDTT